MRLTAAGDTKAFAQLYDLFAPRVLGVAMRVTRDPSLADDVVQETFLGVWRNAAQYNESFATPTTWILTIARYRAIDLLRRRARQPTQELEPDAPRMPSVPDVWAAVATRLDRAMIASALELLPEAQRRAIELAFFSGLTHLEISITTDTPLGTVKSRVRLGLMALRAHLQVAEAAFEPARPSERLPIRMTLTGGAAI